MGILYIVPTPIGNLQDITFRSLEVLLSVQYIACEDTRKTGQLLKLLEERYVIPHPYLLSQREKGNVRKLFSFYDQVEKERIPAILNILQNDFDVALVSDAGTPLISDPGFKLVRTCSDAGVPIVSLPGASSLLPALTASGLPTDRFHFLGYPPEKSGHRKTFYEHIQKASEFFSTTYILFEAPHKLQKTLDEIQQALGNREIVICRELTKIHEEVWRGTLSEAIKHFVHPKGEIVILFHL